jgi:hypothetical protein
VSLWDHSVVRANHASCGVKPRGTGKTRLVVRDPSFVGQGNSPSRALLLTVVEEGELVEVDGLVTGSAAAGPTAQDGL